MAAHEVIIETDEAGVIVMHCLDDGHGWARSFTSPPGVSEVLLMQRTHDDDWKASLPDGIYETDAAAGIDPVKIYLMRHDDAGRRHWHVAATWLVASEPSADYLTLIAEYKPENPPKAGR